MRRSRSPWFPVVVTGTLVVVSTALGLVVNLVSDAIDLDRPWQRWVTWAALAALVIAAAWLTYVTRPDAPESTPRPVPAPEPPPIPAPEPLSEPAPTETRLMIRKDGSPGPRHGAAVTALAYSPDGTLLAAGGSDRRITLWGGEAGAAVTTLASGSNSVSELAFSRDGVYLAAASFLSNAVRVWHTGSFECVLKLAYRSWGDVIKIHAGPHWVHGLDFTADGSALALGSFDKTIRIHDFPGGSLGRTLKAHTEPIKTLAYSPDGTMLASGGNDGTLRIWDAATGALVYELAGCGDWITRLRWTADGTRIVTVDRGRALRVWDVESRQLLLTMDGHTRGISGLEALSDGAHLVTSGGDGTVRLWNVTEGRLVQTVATGAEPVHALAVHPGGGHLVTAGGDGRISVRALEARPVRML